MILFLVILASTYYYSKKEVIRGIEQHSRNLAQYYAERFAGEFDSAATIARTMALTMESDVLRSEDELRAYMEKIMINSPEIYGTCLAFEPKAFKKSKESYAPYAYRKGKELSFRQLGNGEYNYFDWDWYRIPIRSGKPYWTEPYFDEGGGDTLMITYSQPFSQNEKRIGIATIDISLEALSREVNGIRVLKSGYGFIIGRDGKYVTFPDESKIMKESLKESQPLLWNAIYKNGSGFVEAKEPLNGKKAWIVFYTIEASHMTIGIVYPVHEALSRVYDFEKTILWLGLIGMFCLMLIVALASKSIATPIVKLSDGAHRISSGDLAFKLPAPGSRDEVARLTDAFNTMIRELKNQLQQLEKTTAEKERIESEVAIAKEIQLSMLPGHFPAHPDHPGIDLRGKSLPARQVGGDFYDFFWLDDDHLGLVIGDVSGKGVPAALFMALCRTMIRATALQGHSPDACLEEVNRLICPDNHQSMFVTVLYGIFNTRTYDLEYCNGGHLPPLLLSGGEVTSLDGRGGMALGVMEDAVYKSHRINLKEGGTLMLYTDGITEAVDLQDQEFGLPKLEEIIHSHGTEPAPDLIEGIITAVEKFSKGREQFDDLTALVLRMESVLSECAPGKSTVFDLVADVSEIEALADKVSEFLNRQGCPEKIIYSINLVLEELIVNVISYGYDDKAVHQIHIEIHWEDDHRVTVVMVDDGKPFDPVTQAPEPNLSSDASQRGIGGLGLHLAHRMMDDIQYRREKDKNITTLIKKLEPTAQEDE